jgi:hypothetical protein
MERVRRVQMEPRRRGESGEAKSWFVILAIARHLRSVNEQLGSWNACGGNGKDVLSCSEDDRIGLGLAEPIAGLADEKTKR